MATRPAAFAAGGGAPVSQTADVAEPETYDVETPMEKSEKSAVAQPGSDGLTRTDTRVSFEQPIGVTKIESLCRCLWLRRHG